MTYRFNRTDKNQQAIVKALRKIPGVSVEPLTKQKGGCPDLLIGISRGGVKRNYLIELKVGKEDLTPKERIWHIKWQGQVTICRDIDEVLDVINAHSWVDKETA